MSLAAFPPTSFLNLVPRLDGEFRINHPLRIVPHLILENTGRVQPGVRLVGERATKGVHIRAAVAVEVRVVHARPRVVPLVRFLQGVPSERGACQVVWVPTASIIPKVGGESQYLVGKPNERVGTWG